ncbi:MAG: ABC transporter permease [Pseudomonadota bacterium]
MPEALTAFWNTLGVMTQDIVLLVALLFPACIIWLVTMRGYATGPLLRGLMRRHAGVASVFVALIAISVAIGTGLIAQERALRQGSAQAAAPFDLIVAAPGSDVTAMLAAVYLQPARVELVDGAAFDRVWRHENVAMAAPIAFGDSFEGAPVVGTISAFIDHISGDLPEGRMFRRDDEAVAGANARVQIGATVSPAHGRGDDAQEGAHGDFAYTVVGRMAPTGSPWDRAILVPIESVWSIHGLSDGHGPDWDGRLGPPFDPSAFPGTPAILVRPQALWATYALRSEFSDGETMAFFPGAVLARLHGLLGDVRQVMTVLAIVTQVLVGVAVLTGLLILSRLLARQLALLRALGAPNRFVIGLMWAFSSVLVVTGAGLGLGFGVLAAQAISSVVSARTEIAVSASLGWPEVHLVAAFVSITVMLALIPACLTMRRGVIEDLRA